MRVVLISDTHSHHDKLGILPQGQILIHAGDFTESRPPKPQEYKEFIDWFAAQPHPHKILISGNRDQLMDTATCRKYEKSSSFWMAAMQDYVKKEPSINYLEDQPLSIPLGEEDQVTIFGSPWTAIYGKPGKAFQIPPEDLGVKWAKIPWDTDILVTHMPPRGIRDTNTGGTQSGCRALSSELSSRLHPRLHVFGHIHESHGVTVRRGTMHVNAASKRPRSEKMNSPVVVDLDANRGLPCTLISPQSE